MFFYEIIWSGRLADLCTVYNLKLEHSSWKPDSLKGCDHRNLFAAWILDGLRACKQILHLDITCGTPHFILSQGFVIRRWEPVFFPNWVCVSVCVSFGVTRFLLECACFFSAAGGSSPLMSLLPTKLLMSWEDIGVDHSDVPAMFVLFSSCDSHFL